MLSQLVRTQQSGLLPKLGGFCSRFQLALAFVWRGACAALTPLPSAGAGHLVQPRLPLGGGQHAARHVPRVPHQPVRRAALRADPHVPPRGQPHEPLPEERGAGGDRAGAHVQARRALQPRAGPVEQPVWLTAPW